MGRPIRTFTVLPHLPERLQSLQKLAYNMWWCWNYEATALFRRIDPDAFEALDRSPIKLLGAVSQTRLIELLDDDGFIAHMDRVEEAFDNYMNAASWYHETYQQEARGGGGGGKKNNSPPPPPPPPPAR
jgi:glycogen phosphorylase